jgi:GT2 family glycosyltransferase
MRASIIIALYNGEAYIEQCLNALGREAGPDCEAIVIDNASTDNGPAVVARWPGVRLIRNEANQGFAAACNQGADCASGRYLVFLNQDTRVLPGWLDSLLRPLETDSAVACSTSKLLLMNQPDKIQACGTDLHYTGLVFARRFMEAAGDFRESETVGSVDGASFAVRREVWEELGGFDLSFFMYYEDTDLSWRAQLAGYRCVCAPASAVYHDFTLNPSARTLYYVSRNRYVLLLKNWRWSTLLLLLPGLSLAELASWGEAILMGWQGIGAKLRAWNSLLCGLPGWIRLRRKSQAIRQVPDWAILENRGWRMSPRLRTGGMAGQVLAEVANVLFRANYRLALCLGRLFGW